MGAGEIGDCGIIGGRFCFFDVDVDAGLVFILGAAYDLGKESILIIRDGVLAPGVGDVLAGKDGSFLF